MLANYIHFFINELLWMLGWGWYQLLCSVLFLWIAYIFIARIRTFNALLFAIASTVFAGIIYFCLVAGIFVYFFQWRFMNPRVDVYTPLYASLFLGFIFSVLQLLFYIFINALRRIPIFLLFFISIISNSAAALFASCFIKIVF